MICAAREAAARESCPTVPSISASEALASASINDLPTEGLACQSLGPVDLIFNGHWGRHIGRFDFCRSL